VTRVLLVSKLVSDGTPPTGQQRIYFYMNEVYMNEGGAGHQPELDLVYELPATAVYTDQPLPLPLDLPLGSPGSCVKLINAGGAVDTSTADIPVAASTDYRTSLYIYAPTLGSTLTITDETGHTFTVATVTAANADWVRYDVDAPTVAGETTLHLKFAFAGGTESVVYVTGVLVEPSGALHDYFDGSFVNCAWSGTANASGSTYTKTVYSGKKSHAK
jgi:hypothetical protein